MHQRVKGAGALLRADADERFEHTQIKSTNLGYQELDTGAVVLVAGTEQWSEPVFVCSL